MSLAHVAEAVSDFVTRPPWRGVPGEDDDRDTFGPSPISTLDSRVDICSAGETPLKGLSVR